MVRRKYLEYKAKPRIRVPIAVNGQTLGRLWARYLKIRKELGKEAPEAPKYELRWRKMERQAGQLRDRLVVNYLPLVKYVAGRVGARAPGAVELEDMASWGLSGLLDAIETYDPDRPERKAKFETYAISKIRWTILDELRNQDWMPRRLRARAQEVEKAKASLAQKLGRPPSEEEIAAEAGMEVAEYRSFLEQHSQAQVASLDTRLKDDGGPGAEYGALIGDSSVVVDPQSEANLEEVRVQLVDAINKLDERERLVVSFYFYEELTLKEIGKALNVTEARISQILKRALSKLREHLKESALDYGSCAGDPELKHR